MADTDILVSEMTPASQINTTDLMIMTQPDAQAETGYSTKSGTVLQVANKMLKGTEYSTDLPDFTDKTPLGGLEELKADIKALLPIGSASGNPCNFETNIADTLVSLKAAIVASGGNGTPSTPIPIVGHSELNLVRCGKNLLNVNSEDNIAAYINYEGTINSSNAWHTCDYLKVEGGKTYKLSGLVDHPNTNTDNYRTYDSAKNYLGVVHSVGGAAITFNNDVAYIQFCWKNTDANTAMLELGSSSSAYAPYNGTTYLVSFGQTVYGGEYDKSGRLTITHKEFVIDENFNPYSGFPNADNTARIFQIQISDMVTGSDTTPLMCDICKVKTASQLYNDNDYAIAPVNGNNAIAIMIKDTTTGADARTWLASHNITVVYPLATPIEIDVSELSVETIVGTNNIISDGGGDITVEYEVGGLANDVKTVIGTTKFADLSDIPNPPTTDGNYRLVVTITDGKPTYSWEEITE